MLTDTTVNIVTAVCSLLIVVSQISFKPPNMSDLNRYPYYLYEYFYTLVRAPLMIHLILVIMYARNPQMRTTVSRELCAQVRNIFYDVKSVFGS
jgi:hypothetical protein